MPSASSIVILLQSFDEVWRQMWIVCRPHLDQLPICASGSLLTAERVPHPAESFGVDAAANWRTLPERKRPRTSEMPCCDHWSHRIDLVNATKREIKPDDSLVVLETTAQDLVSAR